MDGGRGVSNDVGGVDTNGKCNPYCGDGESKVNYGDDADGGSGDTNDGGGVDDDESVETNSRNDPDQ